ncbi:MAG: hypothetical protein JWQ21_2543 [Herminiimonas sp.]|nr:hypothetical protein [Herminiimonas sp.]
MVVGRMPLCLTLSGNTRVDREQGAVTLDPVLHYEN